MPQLKIADVKDQVDKLEGDMNTRLDTLEELVKAGSGGSDVTINVEKFVSELNKVREDLIGHVNVYNGHIKSLHMKQKKG